MGQGVIELMRELFNDRMAKYKFMRKTYGENEDQSEIYEMPFIYLIPYEHS